MNPLVTTTAQATAWIGPGRTGSRCASPSSGHGKHQSGHAVDVIDSPAPGVEEQPYHGASVKLTVEVIAGRSDITGCVRLRQPPKGLST